MTEVRTTHTADLDAATLRAARTLVMGAFDQDFSEHDWEHSLGGIHALAWEGDELVGHSAVIQRRLLHGGRALRTGYVEGVAVRADQRGRGHASAMMAALERIIRGAYELGALGSSDAGVRLYEARGWKRWQGPSSVLSPAGIQRTPDDDDCLYVLPVTAELDLAGELTCDWRDGDVW